MKIRHIANVLGWVISWPASAGTMGDVLHLESWFAGIGTGYSWTNKPGINNPNPSQWDSAIQGYNGAIGNRGFYTFAVGRKWHSYLDFSLSYLAHENFNYQQYQSGTSNTPDFTGNQRNRYFTLNNRVLLANMFVHPASAWAEWFHVECLPYVGAGIGYAHNYVNNFYTIGTVSVDSVAIGSTDSIGEPVGHNSFAWQGTAAVNLHLKQSHFSVNTGYRYLDGGTFKGSSQIYTNANGFVSATPWTGRVKANQWFVEFQYTV